MASLGAKDLFVVATLACGARLAMLFSDGLAERPDAAELPTVFAAEFACLLLAAFFATLAAPVAVRAGLALMSLLGGALLSAVLLQRAEPEYDLALAIGFVGVDFLVPSLLCTAYLVVRSWQLRRRSRQTAD